MVALAGSIALRSMKSVALLGVLVRGRYPRVFTADELDATVDETCRKCKPGMACCKISLDNDWDHIGIWKHSPPISRLIDVNIYVRALGHLSRGPNIT